MHLFPFNRGIVYCEDRNRDIIIRKPISYDKMINLTRRCCNFKKLEAVLEKYIAKSNNE